VDEFRFNVLNCAIGSDSDALRLNVSNYPSKIIATSCWT